MLFAFKGGEGSKPIITLQVLISTCNYIVKMLHRCIFIDARLTLPGNSQSVCSGWIDTAGLDSDLLPISFLLLYYILFFDSVLTSTLKTDPYLTSEFTPA